ncbi:DUF7146 domain-containing protein [Caulobacter hibisci]|uniref:Toprim domain-containing protein n=1 Tax=Caulobacter hibisci TaxID=2035993 RepID=A0ABS0SX42_9CAUL|nr:toprim domain-containing protein [Caulobacter hibisci]MBI1684212.1 toprim domain-containing protein [Caulobacter hibisci]
MSLRTIVRRLGGDLYDGGRRANIPAPGHGRHDRSVSLWLKDDRLIVHTFGDSDWRAVRDHLRALGLLSDLRPCGTGSTPPTAQPSPSVERRRAVARALWADGVALPRTLSDRHLRSRGIGGPPPGPHALRHHPAAPLAVYRPTRATRPALLAGVAGPDGEISAVEITYLTPGGRRAFDLRLPRKTVGVLPAGGAVRLDPAGPTLLVAEGVFTALSARRRFGLPAWALLSTSNLRAWRPPPGVRAVVIAADRGPDGETSAKILARALRPQGLRVRIVLPPTPHGDWNEFEVAVRRGAAEPRRKGERQGEARRAQTAGCPRPAALEPAS